jgi:chromosome segregation ATPase
MSSSCCLALSIVPQEMVGELLQLRSWNTSLEAEKDALVENVSPLQEQIRELERNEELLTEAQNSLAERLSVSEAGEARLQEELGQSQDATAAVVSELDRLRASVVRVCTHTTPRPSPRRSTMSCCAGFHYE